jgi:hypothetical protein
MTSTVSIHTMIYQREEAYSLYYANWNNIETFEIKKNYAFSVLAFCKRVRDMFDNYEIPEPNSPIDFESWIDTGNHEEKWAQYVQVWRERFNETHGNV